MSGLNTKQVRGSQKDMHVWQLTVGLPRMPLLLAMAMQSSLCSGSWTDLRTSCFLKEGNFLTETCDIV